MIHVTFTLQIIPNVNIVDLLWFCINHSNGREKFQRDSNLTVNIAVNNNLLFIEIIFSCQTTTSLFASNLGVAHALFDPYMLF